MKNRLQKLSIAIVVCALAGCASPVQQGARVYVAPADAAHLVNCEMLGQVELTVSTRFVFDHAESTLEIKNRLRDAVAIKFPNADTVTHSDITYPSWVGPDPNIMGTAFNCFK